jgi:hypothetical protein
MGVYFKNQPLTLMGEVTPRTVIYKHESHKLHQAFMAKVDNSTHKPEVIVKGQPVALNTDGSISPYKGQASEIYLGIAVTDSVNPAYAAQRNFPAEVTVAVEAFAICNYISSATFQCGYVKPTGTVKQDRFVEVATSTTETKFIAINPADAANELVQVLVR